MIIQCQPKHQENTRLLGRQIIRDDKTTLFESALPHYPAIKGLTGNHDNNPVLASRFQCIMKRPGRTSAPEPCAYQSFATSLYTRFNRHTINTRISMGNIDPRKTINFIGIKFSFSCMRTRWTSIEGYAAIGVSVAQKTKLR